MLFLLLVVATTTITTLGTDGQIPIGGRPESGSTKTITATIVTATEPNNEIPFEISDYLLAFISVINQFKF
jgi:hypothetical protein